MPSGFWKKAATVCGVLLLGFALYKFLSSPAKTPIARDFNFHPDSVHEFAWSLQGQSFVFKRASRSKPWEPGVDAQNLQKKLNALGNLQLEKMSAPKDGLVIEVGFTADNRWKGVYADRRLVWTEGLRAGEGFKADPEVARVFEEGLWAFDLHQWSWCEKRPRKISVKTDKLNYELFEKDRAWILKTGGREAALDPTLVEKWLGRNCQVGVDFFRDLKNYPIGMGLADGHFSVEFDGGEKKSFDWKSGFWLVNGERGVQSQALLNSFEEITSLPRR